MAVAIRRTPVQASMAVAIRRFLGVDNETVDPMTSQIQIIQPFKSRYTLIKMLGHGGMGEVYVAHDDELGRDVALKLIHEETSAIPEMRMCFNREARAISLLHHPNVVDIYDFGTTEAGQIYLSTELVHGDSLHGVSSCELPLYTILDLMAQLLEALELAHNRGLIHRDLKAENVLLTFMQGRLWVKLADFGLASLPALLDSTASLRDDTSFGTPGYMAPEQILHGTNYVGPCTDIYAAGILLYEVLSGFMPFDRANALETMRAHLQAPLPRIAWRAHLRETPEPVREALESVVRLALKKEPWLRFLTAHDFSVALQKIASQVEPKPLPVDPCIERIRAVSASQPRALSSIVFEKRDIGAKIRAFEAAEDSGLSSPPQMPPYVESGERSALTKAPEGIEPQTNSGLLSSPFMRAKAQLFDSIMSSVSSTMGADFEFYREILLRSSALGFEFCLNLAEAFWRNDEDRALADCWREALAAWAQNKILVFHQHSEGSSSSGLFTRANGSRSPCAVTVSFADPAFVDVCYAALGMRKLRALKTQAAMALTEVCVEPDGKDLYKIASFWKEANQTTKYVKCCADSALASRRHPHDVDYAFAASRFEELGAFYDAMMETGAKALKHEQIHAVDWPVIWIAAAETALAIDFTPLYDRSCERLKAWVNVFSKPEYLAHLQRLNARRHLRRENYMRAAEIAAISCDSFALCNEEIEYARSQVVGCDAEIALGNVRKARQMLSVAIETFNRVGLKTDIAQAQCRMAVIDWCAGQTGLAFESLRSAETTFEKTGDSVLLTLARLQLNFIQYLSSPTEDRVAPFRRIVDEAARFGDAIQSSRAHVFELIVLMFEGDWGAIESLEARLCEQAGKKGLLPEMNGTLGCIHAIRHAVEGHAEMAQSEITTAIAYFGPHRRRARAYCHTLLGVMSIFMRQIRSGLPAFERARNDFLALNDVFGLAWVCAAQSTLASVCGEYDDAFSMALDGRDLSVNADFRAQASMASVIGIVAAVGAKRYDKIDEISGHMDSCIPNVFRSYYKKWLENSIHQLIESNEPDLIRKANALRQKCRL